MKKYVFILFIFLLGGCRCMRNSSSSMDRSDTATLDLSARSFSFLRDTLAERQTIRIEYWYPYELGPGYNISDCCQADTTTPAVNGSRPSGTGGGVPAVKSIEITNERNSGKSGSKADTTSISSKKSNKENEQKEQSSEARQDNTAVFMLCSFAFAAIVVLFSLVLKKLF